MTMDVTRDRDCPKICYAVLGAFRQESKLGAGSHTVPVRAVSEHEEVNVAAIGTFIGEFSSRW